MASVHSGKGSPLQRQQTRDMNPGKKKTAPVCGYLTQNQGCLLLQESSFLPPLLS